MHGNLSSHLVDLLAFSRLFNLFDLFIYFVLFFFCFLDDQFCFVRYLFFFSSLNQVYWSFGSIFAISALSTSSVAGWPAGLSMAGRAELRLCSRIASNAARTEVPTVLQSVWPHHTGPTMFVQRQVYDLNIGSECRSCFRWADNATKKLARL